MKFFKFTITLGLLVFIFFLLQAGKSFLIPLVISIVVCYLIINIANEFEKINIIKIPRWLSISFSIITITCIIWFFIQLINNNVNQLIAEGPHYQKKLEILIKKLYEYFDLSEIFTIKNLFSSLDIQEIIGVITNILTSLASYTGMIIIFVLLILMEYPTFKKKLSLTLEDKEKYLYFKTVMQEINTDIRKYIKVKTFTSLLTAILSYIILIVVDVDFASFWALLVFLLNYIPTFGSIVAVIFPVIITIIQFETLHQFALVTIMLTAIQFSIGNILEPKLMGHSLNLSPLVIILSLALWGKIWGVTGMFLCVPITVIINIILSKFPSTRPIAIMLSGTGKINT